MFSDAEKAMIQQRGSDPEKIAKQLEQFKAGFPFTELVAPATAKRGIHVLSPEQSKVLQELFDMQKAGHNLGRFVPASGAATRMFKSVFALRDSLLDKNEKEQWEMVKKDPEAEKFFNELEKYPFYKDLQAGENAGPVDILSALLDPGGLNYGQLPKGLLKFHSYDKETRTAFEEHLHEAARIMLPSDTIQIHFTVSEEHLDGFQALEKELLPKLEKLYDVNFQISYSFQKKETDTIAVDMDNNPLKDESGGFVFRPGGHGALIQNLQELPFDIFFVNNIDNVSPDRNSQNRLASKKMLAGLLIEAKDKAQVLLNRLNEGDSTAIDDAIHWLEETCFVDIPDFIQDEEEKREWLLSALDRPIRVCGMVKNEGEPGGGPFFTRDTRAKVSLQIVESSQVDAGDPAQLSLFKGGSHFNPVDLVCSITNGKGEKYNLPDYIDHDTGFISEKSVKGKNLKALELPGLWNGSMAGWITLFVEIPAATFTPVKTIFDLVRPAHS